MRTAAISCDTSRIWPGAVQRNRLKRVIREAFRLTLDELPVGIDLIVLAAKPRLDLDLGTARTELVLLAQKAHRRYLEAQDEALGDDAAGGGSHG